jgi:beta-phosphoglucomutase-like phosphatase (HAD superfamily)
MIFTVDGTLVDTNRAQVEAWCRAFKDLGYDVPPERIKVEIARATSMPTWIVPSS